MSECLLWRYGSAVACCRACCSRPGYGLSPLGGGRHEPHHRTTRTYTGLGKQALGRHKQNLVCTRTQEKGAVTPLETDPDMPMSVQESLEEAKVSSGLHRVGGTECSSACIGPFEGGHHYLHYLHHNLASGQITGREHSATLQRKLD